MADKRYAVELSTEEIIVLVSEGRALAEGRRPLITDTTRGILRGLTDRLGALDCGHGYTVMDSCPMCDAEEDQNRT